MTVKLNIGAGDTVIEGFTPIDRKLGSEAFPLQYEDGSVDEIRASHILEHFSFGDVKKALNEWHRVLKPGARIRISVPDFDEIKSKLDPNWRFHLMGGQTDADNFHRSCFTEQLLCGYLNEAGFDGVCRWQSDNTDSASLKVSLNLEARKHQQTTESTSLDLKISAVMSVPRVGWNDNWGCVLEALRPFNIPVRRFTGAFWGQCIQRAFESCVADDLDWILSIDYDTMFTSKHIDSLMGRFGQSPEIDAIAGLQARRLHETPLMTRGKDTGVDVDGSPIKVHTAHFGLTLIRVDALKKVAKPWFHSEPNKAGEWGDDHMDDDIWFWHQWRLAGNTIYVDPEVRIGHLELMVSEFDESMQNRHVHVGAWRDAHGIGKGRHA